jgi:hypothetical protein
MPHLILAPIDINPPILTFYTLLTGYIYRSYSSIASQHQHNSVLIKVGAGKKQQLGGCKAE